MRLGFIGPADTDGVALEQAAKLLICDLEVDAVMYLGEDDALRDFMATHELEDGHDAIEQRVADIAATGSADDIERVLRQLRGSRYLGKLRVAPPAPRRAMEMLDDRIVIIVRDKSTIEEEDVVNSNVVVYGDAAELMFKRFGPRCFFSPGPLGAGHVGLIDDRSESGGVVLKAIELTGDVSWSEPIQGRGAKLMVTP
jgi:hypothetical protein